jgi:hypothetical protein
MTFNSSHYPLLLPTTNCRSDNDNNKKYQNQTTVVIPIAPNAISILGHALWYQRDPVGYLQHCTKTVGPIFRLNMAGKQMILVCGGSGEGGRRNSQDGVSIPK